MFKINEKKCADCGYCKYVCPFDAIEHNVEEKYYYINQEKCMKCGQCFKSCIGSFITCDDDDLLIDEITITDNCIGCTMCSKVCPNHAINGSLKIKHEIDADKCIKCGACFKKCPKKAIVIKTVKAKK